MHDLAEPFAVLKPGGALASVTGDYIRDGKRVYFGQQWCTAAEQAGFVLVAHAKVEGEDPSGHGPPVR